MCCACGYAPAFVGRRNDPPYDTWPARSSGNAVLLLLNGYDQVSEGLDGGRLVLHLDLEAERHFTELLALMHAEQLIVDHLLTVILTCCEYLVAECINQWKSKKSIAAIIWNWPVQVPQNWMDHRADSFRSRGSAMLPIAFLNLSFDYFLH